MKITVKQLKEIIKEQLEEIGDDSHLRSRSQLQSLLRRLLAAQFTYSTNKINQAHRSESLKDHAAVMELVNEILSKYGK